MVLATGVILSYQKQNFLRRQLLYYANYPVHLILADGSDKDWSNGELGSVGAMTWEYFRLSGYYSYIPRMAEALRRVPTRYMFFLDDEECMLMTGIEKAANYLDLNLDHSCAGGLHATTSQSLKRLCLVPHYGQKNNFSLIDEDPYQRFKTLFISKRQKSLVYTLRRSRDALAFAETFENYEFSGKLHVMFENLHNGFSALAGKYKGGLYPFMIRNGSSTPPDVQEKYSINEDQSQSVCRQLVDSITKSGRILGHPPEENLTKEGFLARFLPRSTVDRGKVLRSVVKNSLGHCLFDCFPKIYWVLNKNGLMTFSQYSSKFACGQSEVLRDISKIEKIWKKFPVGLSNIELENELLELKNSK